MPASRLPVPPPSSGRTFAPRHLYVQDRLSPQEGALEVRCGSVQAGLGGGGPCPDLPYESRVFCCTWHTVGLHCLTYQLTLHRDRYLRGELRFLELCSPYQMRAGPQRNTCGHPHSWGKPARDLQASTQGHLGSSLEEWCVCVCVYRDADGGGQAST